MGKQSDYGYTVFGNERYKHNSVAFDVTSRYTGQKIDEETGLYFYQSRYYDPELGRFTQADTIVPSAETSQALNRYAYVKNNPLKFTDPDGHSWFSKAWKKIKGWIGTILTVALSVLVPGLGLAMCSIIGSAVGTIVNGGTWKSFAIGVAIGIAAGAIASGLGSAMNGGGFWAGAGSYLADGTSIAVLVGNVAAGAITGAVSGAISSAVYGGNWGKNIGQGAIGGLIGAGLGRTTRAILNSSFMKPTMEVLKQIASGIKRGFEIGRAIVDDTLYGPLDTITIWGADKDSATPVWRKIEVKSYRFTKLTGNSYTLSATEIHVSQDTLDNIRNDTTFASKSNPAYDNLKDKYMRDIPGTGRGNWLERHIAHEIGHTCQAVKLGPFYLPLVAPVTSFKSNPHLNGWERDASRRGLYGGIAE